MEKRIKKIISEIDDYSGETKKKYPNFEGYSYEDFAIFILTKEIVTLHDRIDQLEKRLCIK